MASVQEILERLAQEQRDGTGRPPLPKLRVPVPVTELIDQPYEEELPLTDPVKTRSALPTRKVGASSLAGAVTLVLVAVANRYGLQIDGELASMITLVLTALTGYLIKDKPAA